MDKTANQLPKKGKVEIDRDILLSIINLATKEINGVASLTNAELPLHRKWSKTKSEGVEIKFDVNGVLNVDVYIKVYIGYSVPDIAYRVQENIKNSLNSMVGIKPGKINVHVCGVDVDEASEQ
ncbi:MAG: Asp23/Gls24 family envelope stress response protein [Clostridia bacterium]|nr:Asp23/Gls24 family envelope stress response protein [Clostridia bacterium]